ncbi:hypothetical protein QR97_22525 [Streptomyces sp. PBH53]|uniref:hypothetical protein n=1 Tax=Streptomyces TaxID=1883 RepID=UPI0006556BBE|nr:hypothetical protein [Streptomyces sp. PBH53]AKN72182.1 hypothetical protein QR97_22525 [Streptomyces sp. PBH53]
MSRYADVGDETLWNPSDGEVFPDGPLTAVQGSAAGVSGPGDGGPRAAVPRARAAEPSRGAAR